MGKTRDHLKKIRHTKGTFHAKMKDRNGMDLTEVEDINKRWQEYFIVANDNKTNIYIFLCIHGITIFF